MALPTASDNKFPKLLLDMQTSTPAAPTDEDWKLYAKPDGIYARSSNSIVGPFAAASSATTVPAHAWKVSRDTSNQSMGNNTFTAVQFNATDSIDTDSIHDPSSNNTRATIPSISGVTTGLWEVSLDGYSDATSPRADVKFRVNNTTDSEIFIGPTGPSGALRFTATTLLVLTAGDYVEAFVRTTAGNFNVVGTDATAKTFFKGVFLGKVT